MLPQWHGTAMAARCGASCTLCPGLQISVSCFAGEGVSQSRHVLRADAHLEFGPCEIASDRLAAAAKVRCKKHLGYGVERQAVLRHGKAVALLRIEHVGYGEALCAHGLDDLVRLGLLHARVVGALPDQEGLDDAGSRVQRRPLLQE